jgi:flagellar hook-basal body complex protein FliE
MGPIDAPGIPLAQPVQPLVPREGPFKSGDVTQASPFADMLETALKSANERSHIAQNQAHEFAAGRNEDIHGTMLALSEADIELRFVGNVRNKVVDAFYELWRMQI